MNIMKTLKIVLTLVVLALVFGGCKYDFILPEQVPDIPTDEPVKFATQIAPIFTQAGCTSCHKSGGQSPDLSSGNVYSVIVPALVNTSNPESSPIYDYASPETSKHDWKKYSATQAAYILTWIEQGAQNN